MVSRAIKAGHRMELWFNAIKPETGPTLSHTPYTLYPRLGGRNRGLGFRLTATAVGKIREIRNATDHDKISTAYKGQALPNICP